MKKTNANSSDPDAVSEENKDVIGDGKEYLCLATRMELCNEDCYSCIFYFHHLKDE